MKQHKRAKEIKAWADGAEIEYFDGNEWVDCIDDDPYWSMDVEYRIKPQPKEPQYLYVYMNPEAEMQFFWNPITPLKTDLTYQGKIKLEE